ncbi:MAG: P-II family nitrogen regulator [Bacilli bacterium]|nr:P-II family nitrogen regulator [Bacilli bacterium]
MADVFIPYEENHELIQLGLVITVVAHGQAGAIEDRLKKCDCALMLRAHGSGTATSEFYEALGINDSKKQIIFSVLRKDRWSELSSSLEKRFSVSSFSRGISFFVPMNSISGVSVYKMLANKQQIDYTVKRKTRKEVTPMDQVSNQIKKEYVAIFAVVNSGFTDLVMDAARSNGARGGTIINARGTGNKEIESFFGVVITPEKEIVMILVPENISDTVISAINKQAGIDTKGQGIVFSLPVDAVAGLAEEEKIQKEAQ